ncbi:MAG: hypothetical protein A2V63_11105 [Candidatus Eisenbacteria bacterium RBG_19FT_COMBO_70_11]|nr:MAG: hypothetical protein A2V63_11105 [Candidatus Eisenbacteria bacterium RBG_19FT_COMBO_70_11]
MKPESRRLLDKAARAIHAAETLLREGIADFAAGRAYYAMFYAAEALLFERGLQFRKHGAVHGAFGEHFIRSGLLDTRFHRWLLDAFDVRIQGDYGVDAVVSLEEARDMIDQAGEFLREAERIAATSG